MRRWLAKQLAKSDKTLVGFWPLQDNLLDYSGNGNHGSSVKNPQTAPVSTNNLFPAYIGGMKGYTFGIYSTDNFLDMGNAPSTNFSWTSPFTVSFWLYTLQNIQSSTGALVSRVLNSAGNYTGYNIALSASFVPPGIYQPQIIFGLYFNSNFSINIVTQLDLATSVNRWYHVVATYNGNKAVSGLSIYINSELAKIVSTNSNLTNDISNTSARLAVGQGLTELSARGQFAISSVRIYNRVLSNFEVMRIYNTERVAYRVRRAVGLPETPKEQNSLTLFINGSTDGSTPKNNNFPLYIDGGASISGSLPLYVQGGGQSNFSTLFIQGSQSINNSLPLFTIANAPNISKGLNFFVNCPTIPASPTALPLLITGNHPGSSGMFKSTSLFIKGVGLNTPMNMFMAGELYDSTPRHMNMFVAGDTQLMGNVFPLFLCNTSSGVNNNTPLSITGEGTVPLASGTPYGKSLNLFIQRWPSNAMPLFIAAATTKKDNLSLFINGSKTAQSGIPLSMASVRASGTGPPLPLFISGY
jgi:hypothetical protein